MFGSGVVPGTIKWEVLICISKGKKKQSNKNSLFVSQYHLLLVNIIHDFCHRISFQQTQRRKHGYKTAIFSSVWFVRSREGFSASWHNSLPSYNELNWLLTSRKIICRQFLSVNWILTVASARHNGGGCGGRPGSGRGHAVVYWTNDPNVFRVGTIAVVPITELTIAQLRFRRGTDDVIHPDRPSTRAKLSSRNRAGAGRTDRMELEMLLLVNNM